MHTGAAGTTATAGTTHAAGTTGAVGTARVLAAELVGTAALVTAVIGSGIMAQRLTHDVALQLLVNAIATVAALAVLVAVCGPVSSAHLNPAVTLAQAVRRRHPWGRVPAYLVAQLVGALLGAALANRMFDLPVFAASRHERTGVGLWLGEVVATAGLVLVVAFVSGGLGPQAADRARLAPLLVPAWILGAYFFTSSTSFANPAVTVARALSDTFAGIAPASVPGFVVAQLVGAAVGVGLATILTSTQGRTP
jgi:arsenate reductase